MHRTMYYVQDYVLCAGQDDVPDRTMYRTGLSPGQDDAPDRTQPWTATDRTQSRTREDS